MNPRRDRPGEFAMRPDWNSMTSDPDSPTDRLGQVWAATRTAELSSATMDALWASASRELDRIEAARREEKATPDRLRIAERSRRHRIFAGVALAQAAVLLVGVGFALTRPNRANAPQQQVAVISPSVKPESTQATPAPRLVIEVAAGQTLHFRFGEDGARYDFLTEPSISSTLPEGMPHDVFNAIESMASL